jgi:hypothetical protein
MKMTAPHRVTRTYTQKLAAEPAVVFPLLCPVREAEWIEGWDPELVISQSGLAEPDCVFVTNDGTSESIWYVTKHDADDFRVEMIKITPRITACKLIIEVRAAKEGSEADVTYTHTSLGPDGDAFVDSFSERYYEGFMREWETRLNHYLANGTMLSASGN